ncbi:MAG: lipid II:glycine glycyltransferase FemX [Candidatus Dormibacteraceae bacterium]
MTPSEWDAGLARAASPSPLLQSWAWGEVQAGSGWELERVEVPGARATVLLKGRPRRAGYVPRGPVPATEAALAGLIRWARSRRLASLKVEPEAGFEMDSVLVGLGFAPAAEVQPASTLIVDLAPDSELLASFKPKTRYNVRLAARKGVEVVEGADPDELARQAGATAERQRIRLPGRDHYARLLEELPWCRTYVARAGGEPVAAILVAQHDGRAYYLFGGSDGRRRELMPAYALQFQAMVAAHRRGCRDYDLWGLPPESDPAHPWFGLWQFKTGFGGRPVRYAGAWELVLDPVAARVAAGADRLRGLARRLPR